ncbi:cupin domain-containing protein [Thermovibrio sp.]
MVERTGITDEGEVFKRLTEEGFKNLYAWEDPPGAFYDWHAHPFEEVRWVLRGSIKIGTEDGVVELFPGDKLIVPKGSRHWAKVGEEGVVYVCGSR